MRQLELYGVEKGGDGGRVDEFRKTLKAVEGGMLERDAERGNERKRKLNDVPTGDEMSGGVDGDDVNNGSGRKRKEEKRMVEMIDLKVVKDDLNKAYPLVYWAFKVSLLLLVPPSSAISFISLLCSSLAQDIGSLLSFFIRKVVAGS